MPEIQVTLDSGFNDQSGYVKVTYNFLSNEKRKKCRRCGKWKKLEDFSDSEKYIDGKLLHCKECRMRDDAYFRKYMKTSKGKRCEERRRKSSKRIEYNREHSFLYRYANSHTVGFLRGSGVCVLCGYDEPLGLENHHIIPRSGDVEDFVLSLCGSCHNKYTAGCNQEKHMRAVQNAIEKSKWLWKDF